MMEELAMDGAGSALPEDILELASHFPPRVEQVLHAWARAYLTGKDVRLPGGGKGLQSRAYQTRNMLEKGVTEGRKVPQDLLFAMMRITPTVVRGEGEGGKYDLLFRKNRNPAGRVWLWAATHAPSSSPSPSSERAAPPPPESSAPAGTLSGFPPGLSHEDAMRELERRERLAAGASSPDERKSAEYLANLKRFGRPEGLRGGEEIGGFTFHSFEELQEEGEGEGEGESNAR